MSQDSRLKGVADWQNALLKRYREGRTLHFRPVVDGVCVAYSEEPAAGGRKAASRILHGIIPRVKAIIVGLDIREYSRRLPEHQLFLTMNLHIGIRRTIELLRSVSIIPPREPRVVVQTGDGALVVFTFLDYRDPGYREQDVEDQVRKMLRHDPILKTTEFENELKALEIFCRSRIASPNRDQDAACLPMVADQVFSFIFTMNAMMQWDNERQGLEARSFKVGLPDPENPAFPAECRFAVSYAEVLPLYDVNGAVNCVGEGMVTCSRILSSDHGCHFLVDQKLLNGLETSGGLRAICGGKWDQRLHHALMSEVRIKSGRFRYADVFGFHTDRPIIEALKRTSMAPTSYHIGSHDVGSLEDRRP